MKTLCVSLLVSLFACVGLAEAGPKSKLVKKQFASQAKKIKAVATKRAAIATQIKRYRAQEAKLKAQLKAVQTRLRGLYKLWKQGGGGTAVSAKNAVRQCKRAMRRTFGPHDTRKERKALLDWCEKTFAQAKVFAPLAPTRQ